MNGVNVLKLQTYKRLNFHTALGSTLLLDTSNIFWPCREGGVKKSWDFAMSQTILDGDVLRCFYGDHGTLKVTYKLIDFTAFIFYNFVLLKKRKKEKKRLSWRRFFYIIDVFYIFHIWSWAWYIVLYTNVWCFMSYQIATTSLNLAEGLRMPKLSAKITWSFGWWFSFSEINYCWEFIHATLRYLTLCLRIICNKNADESSTYNQ